MCISLRIAWDVPTYWAKYSSRVMLSFEKPAHHTQGHFAILQLPELSLEKSYPLLLIRLGVRVHPEQDGVQKQMSESNGTVPVLQSWLHLPVKTPYQRPL
jgi:hypothetical protein